MCLFLEAVLIKEPGGDSVISSGEGEWTEIEINRDGK